MNDHFDFSIPVKTREPHGPGMWLVVFAGIAFAVVLVGLVAGMVTSRDKGGKAAVPATTLSAEPQKALALKLEKQGLSMLAIQAWKEYLSFTTGDNVEAAKVWYRIGGLYQASANYSAALDAYYRSESMASIPEIKDELVRRTQDCLASLGKLSALRHELAGRVGIDTNAASDVVVAELGPEKITMTDLDRRIEQQIDMESKEFRHLPEEEYLRAKENLLRKFMSPQEKSRMLEMVVGEELLFRWAGESKLADDPAAASLLRNIEHGLLARLALEKELGNGIRITAGDLKTWYAAHTGTYTEPEKARVEVVRFKSETDADSAISRASSEGALAGAAASGWVSRDSGVVPGIGMSPDAEKAIFATEAGKVCARPVKADGAFWVFRVAEKLPARRLEFDEARDAVARDLYSAKAAEVQSAIMRMLKEKYDVVIHTEAFGARGKE